MVIKTSNLGVLSKREEPWCNGSCIRF